MESRSTLFDPLFQRIEQYGKSNYDLVKLKTIDKSADVISALCGRLIILLTGFLGLITFSTGVSLLIGYYLGVTAYGFFFVTGFYILIALILWGFSPSIKTRIYNSIITAFNQ